MVLLPSPARAGEIIPLCSGSGCGWHEAVIPTNVESAQTPMGDVMLLPGDLAIAVGDGGTVLRSVDSGESFVQVDFPESAFGLSVLALDPFGQLWVGGQSATLGLSTDQGLAWSLVSETGLSGNITSLGFPSANFAFATTSTGFYLSSDDGQSWTLDTALGNGYGRTAAFYNADDGWVDFGLNPVVEYTSDGARTFTAGSPNDVPPLTAEFLPTGPSSTWYLGADGSVYSTSNGVSWKLSDHAIGEKAFGLAYVDGTDLWEVADQGNIFYSPDDGSCWLEQPVPIVPDFSSVAFSNANDGVIVGDGAALYTTDGGTGVASNYTYPSSIAPVGGSPPTLKGYDSDDGPLPPCSTAPPYDYDLVGSAIGVGLGAALVTVLLSRRAERKNAPPPPPEAPAKASAHQRKRHRYRSRRRYLGDGG